LRRATRWFCQPCCRSETGFFGQPCASRATGRFGQFCCRRAGKKRRGSAAGFLRVGQLAASCQSLARHECGCRRRSARVRSSSAWPVDPDDVVDSSGQSGPRWGPRAVHPRARHVQGKPHSYVARRLGPWARPAQASAPRGHAARGEFAVRQGPPPPARASRHPLPPPWTHLQVLGGRPACGCHARQGFLALLRAFAYIENGQST